MFTLRFKIYILVLTLILIYGLINYKRFPAYSKGIVELLGVTLLLESLSRLFIFFYRSSCPSYHILVALQFLFYLKIYLKLFNYSRTKENILRIYSIVSFLLVIIIGFYFQSVLTFPTYGFSMISLFVVVNSILGFNNMINYPESAPLLKQPSFWFCLGSLIFFTFTFFSFGFFNPLYRILKVIPNWLNVFIWIMNLVLYGSYFLTLRLSLKPTQAQ